MRAQQLAEVALAVYEAGCSAIHLPLEPSNPLLAILKQAVEREGDERAVGQTLANALLENVLQAVDEQADSFPSLMVRGILLSQQCLWRVCPTLLANVCATWFVQAEKV